MKKQIKVTYEANNVDGHDFLICERVQFCVDAFNGMTVRFLGTDENGNSLSAEFACIEASRLINIKAA